MPYLIPARAPLTPEEVDRAFDYLLALQMGGGNYASGRTPATPELAFLLLRLTENIVFPVTGVLGDGEPHADSFALDELGCILLSALRDWTRDSPTTAVLGITRSTIRFVENVSPTPTTTETPAPPCARSGPQGCGSG
ncbi:hypothetical protein [Streptomyces sp. KS 21]|uniref:hypothetical protein n=1 Tax=Streptomyces sp. KS 21 TaxID=2485150 RepID=UPI0010637347|nr:hypothetical protein [Streptomyces sp. KS 21]TDU68998.1 hypothetical protein EDD91_7645 [Streptomyces sp. KS 21]